MGQIGLPGRHGDNVARRRFTRDFDKALQNNSLQHFRYLVTGLHQTSQRSTKEL